MVANQSQSQTGTDIQPIKRTICIGLGGTGKEILMQIRKLIIDRHEKLEQLPIVSFVHLDTNPDEANHAGLPEGDTYRGENLLLTTSEKVQATMNAQQINQLTEGLKRSRESGLKSPYDHIGEWFPPQKLNELQSIQNGAGAIRPVGRLAFFHNRNNIESAIKNADQRTQGYRDWMLTEKNIDVATTGLNIIVVGSLCGGTGSGMFLDMAYLLRSMYPNSQDTKFISYLVIATELYGNTSVIKANTYAALKELDYYSSVKNIFDYRYDSQDTKKIRESRSPFDFCYLIGNTTYGGHQILKRENLFHLIAHRIFVEFAEEKSITNKVKGIRNNQEEPMEMLDRHPRNNVQRYITFGMAKIYFPRDLTINNSLNKLKQQIISFWLNGVQQSADSKELLDQFLLNYDWRGQSERDYEIFAIKLEENTLRNNKTFVQLLKNWQNKLITEIENCRTREDRQNFVNQLEGEVNSEFKKVQQGETENIRGIWLTDLQKNNDKITQKLTKDILNYFNSLLEPSNSNFSVNNARGWLQAMLTKINELLRYLDEEKQNSPFPVTSVDINKKCNNIVQILTDIENQKGGCLGLGKLSNKVKNRDFKSSAIQGMQEIYKLIKQNFDLTLNNESIKILRNLQSTLQTLINKSNSFYNLLGELEGSYDKQEEKLNRIDRGAINGEAIFNSEDNKQYFQALLPEEEKVNLLVEISHAITETALTSQSLYKFFFGETIVSKDDLHKFITLNIEKKYQGKSSDLTQSVVNSFMAKHPFSKAEIRLRQIMEEADYLLPLNLNDAYLINNHDGSDNLCPKAVNLIAFRQTDEPENQKFRNLLTDKMSIENKDIVPTQSESEIFILKEIAGFPLRIINGIEDLKTQYELIKGKSYLHNDYAKNFLDIIPPPPEKMKQLQDLFYTCLAFGKITRNIPRKRKQYEAIKSADKSYTQIVLIQKNPTFNEHNEIILSSVWAEALEQILQNGDLYEYLEDVKEDLINEIATNPNVWESYASEFKSFRNKVQQFNELDENFNQQELLLGMTAKVNTPAREGILERIYNQIMGIVEEINSQHSEEFENSETDDYTDANFREVESE